MVEPEAGSLWQSRGPSLPVVCQDGLLLTHPTILTHLAKVFSISSREEWADCLLLPDLSSREVKEALEVLNLEVEHSTRGFLHTLNLTEDTGHIPHTNNPHTMEHIYNNMEDIYDDKINDKGINIDQILSNGEEVKGRKD